MHSILIAAGFISFVGTSRGHLLQFSQQTVAGTPSDLMTVRHLIIRGDNVSIGRKLAEIARLNHHSELVKISDPGVGKRQMEWMRTRYPERYARAVGVREGFGLAANTDRDTTSLPIDMTFKPACSVLYYPGSMVTTGHAMLSRNYDFSKGSYAEITRRGAGGRSMTGDPYVIEMYPDTGFPSLYVCAYDLEGGAIDGVNSKGVSVALLADDLSKTRTRGHPGFGLSEVDLPRFVLDRCASAREARRLLRNVPYFSTFSPCHYIVGDASGDSFIFEIGGDGTHYVIDGKGRPQMVTNHSVAEFGTANLPQGDSFDRYRKLQRLVALQKKTKFTPADVKVGTLCVAVPASERISATLWHAVYDLRDRSVQISFCLSRADEAKERRTPYLRFQLSRT